MKKLTLFAVALLASIASFAALNPFAYGLSSQLSADETKLTVNYSLNAPATAVNIVVLNGATVVKHISSDKITKGSHTIEIPTADFPKTTNLTWKIEVSGSSVETPTIQNTKFSFYLPSSLAVDVDTESDYFGRWYAIEAARNSNNQTHSGYHTYEPNKNVRALYAFEATLDPIANASGTYGFTGGGNWGATETNVNGDYLNNWRVTTSGGRVFIGKFRKDHVAVVEVNPANLSANFTDVIPAGKRVVSISATGRGENLKLVILDTDLNITEYDLGAASSVTNTTPSRTYTQMVGSNKLTVRNDATITYDNVGGGIWLNQNREGTDLPTIAHLTPEGVDYDNLSAGVSHLYCRNSGIAINPAGTELAVVGAGAKTLTIYSVSKDATGKIALTKKYTISTAGSNHTALSYDYAGNLYVANRSVETITFYAMPYSGMVATPAASKYAFQLGRKSYTITATANDATMGSVTGTGTYYEGEEVTLKATANAGHAFVDWSNGATEPTLTFTATKDSTVQANFKVLSYTVALATNDEAKGTVSGAGTYEYGTKVELTATPADGYELLYWSDRSTDNPRTITVDGNEALSAYFIKTYTQEPTFTIEKLWENAQVPAATGDGYQAVGWDGKIYMQNKTVGKIQVFSNGTDAAVDYATSGTGQQIAIDEAGNLIVFNAYFATATPNAVLIYPKGNTEGKAVSFTLLQPARCDFFSASGNIYSAEGGYIYFYCNGKTVINRLKITNGAATAADVTTDVVGGSIFATPQNVNHVMVDIFGNLVTHARSSAINSINVLTNECATFTLPSIKMGTLGGCSFELGGKELWAYHAGATNYSSEWNIYNMTDKKFLSDEVLYAVDKANSTNNACNWLNVQKVDEKTAYIYQFCPKKGVAAWKVTCDTGEEPENPTVLDNTVVAPQVEKIVRNGQVLIIRDGKTYNMMGQEVK